MYQVAVKRRVTGSQVSGNAAGWVASPSQDQSHSGGVRLGTSVTESLLWNKILGSLKSIGDVERRFQESFWSDLKNGEIDQHILFVAFCEGYVEALEPLDRASGGAVIDAYHNAAMAFVERQKDESDVT